MHSDFSTPCLVECTTSVKKVQISKKKNTTAVDSLIWIGGSMPVSCGKEFLGNEVHVDQRKEGS